MQIFRLPGQFRRHMEQYENYKKEVSRKYRQQLTETTKQMNTLNNHIMNTQLKFKTVNNKMDKIEENIKNDFKEHKNEIKEKIKKASNKMDKLKEDVKNDLEQNKNEIKEEIKTINNKMDKIEENIKNDLEQNKNEIKNYVNSELNRSDNFMDFLQKQSRKQKQKFDNYKQQTNKRFNKIEQHMDKLNRDNSSLLDMLKCLIFGKNDSKRNITFEDKQDYATNENINNFDLNKSFTSMNLRRTNSCFFSIDDDNRNNNSNNSFTVFNRKKDIIPNLESEDNMDLKEKNK